MPHCWKSYVAAQLLLSLKLGLMAQFMGFAYLSHIHKFPDVKKFHDVHIQLSTTIHLSKMNI